MSNLTSFFLGFLYAAFILKCDSAQCGVMRGKVRTTFRIVGGGTARIGNYAWQVSLTTSRNRHFCGGSIINENWVLTAAHCLGGGSQKKVIAGSHYQGNRDSTGSVHRIIREVKHPGYTGSYSSDIGVVRVSPPFRFKEGNEEGRGAIGPVCLPEKGQSFSTSDAIVSGFGTTRENGYKSQVMKAARVKLLSDDVCRRVYRSRYNSNTMVCAGDLRGGTDSCQGDSGGPLVVEINNHVTQVGVVSFGYGCARRNTPGVYSKVATFRNWIKQQTGV